MRFLESQTKRMKEKANDMNNPDNSTVLKETAAFLAEYASLLLGCGSTCIRIEKNTRRMAEAFGVNIDIFIMPAHVTVSVWNTDRSQTEMAQRKTASCGISFDLNTRLSQLSWKVADNSLPLHTAVERFQCIKTTKPTGKWEVLILASFANAAFCRLFGGDYFAMLIVFVSTLTGYRLKQIMLEDGRDVRLTFLCASFFSASISAGGHIFNIGSTPELALGTSVLYLIPGVPYINSVSDMIYRHYLCAFSRFLDAAVLTACLSAGLCAGMLMLGLKWF
ncbi:MAG: threonine/serine exporter family protein [Prevotella sp.]|nr:threonine/serine exporter family protein [Prevotella sp.]MDD7691755.1 threonine/serine exporter family protein [Prevotella sp.]